MVVESLRPGVPEADEVLYCVFLGCSQKGMPTSEAKCPECGRYTTSVTPAQTVPVADSAAHSPAPSNADGLTWMRPRPTRASPLVADALRVAAVFNVLAWLVAALGAVAGLLMVVNYLSAENLLGALVALVASGSYVAGAWAVMMLGSVAARHIANLNGLAGGAGGDS